MQVLTLHVCYLVAMGTMVSDKAWRERVVYEHIVFVVFERCLEYELCNIIPQMNHCNPLDIHILHITLFQ